MLEKNHCFIWPVYRGLAGCVLFALSNSLWAQLPAEALERLSAFLPGINAAIVERQEIKSVEASDFSETLERTTKKWGSVGDIVACEAWDSAAYRFQLLTMMADADLRITRSAEEALDPIISIPVEVDFDQTGEMVEAEVSGEKRTMSRGRLRRIQ